MGKKKVKKKKKKGVGKKGKKKGALGGAETDELIPAFVRDYVTIHFKLINWSFLDFSLEVCVNNTKLYSLKRKITQRHGRISNLRVYHGSMQPQTEMKDDMMTLEEYGVQGLPKIPPPNLNASIGGDEMGVGEAPSPEVKEKAEVVFWYDFKPFTHDDPLLLR